MKKLVTKITMIALALSLFIPSIASAEIEVKTTSLHKAIQQRNPAKALRIIDAGVVNLDAKMADKNQNTALHLAVWYGCTEIVESLVEKGASLEIRNGEGRTPIYTAIQRFKRVEIGKYLIDNGARLDIEDNGRWIKRTPLHFALEQDEGLSIHIINAMVKQGLNIDRKGKLNYLHIAIYQGNSRVAKHLIDNGVDVNVKGANEYTPLLASINLYEQNKNNNHVMSIHMEIIKHLVDAGADLDVKDKWGDTPLHGAVKSRSLDMVKYLVAAGADIDIKGIFGRTPFQLATHYRLEEIADVITAKKETLIAQLLNDIYYTVKNW